MKLLLIPVAALVLTLPSKHVTPGWYNPDVKQSTINKTICVRGWTATIRPPYSYTSYVKRSELRYERLPGTLKDYELDHFVPLELGGSSYDTRNLWMEPRPEANRSDPLENKLKKKVCAGTITLREGQKQIMAYKRNNG